VLQIATAVNADGRIEVFAIGTNQALFHMWQTAPNSGWSNWASLLGGITRIATAVNVDGTIEVFAIGTDKALNHIYQTSPGGPWSSWVGLGGAVLQIATAVNGDGRIEVFAIGTNQALFHIRQTAPGGPWSGWESLAGGITQIATAVNADGRIEVFAIGTDTALNHIWQTAPGGAWSSWAGLGGAVLQIATAVNGDGRIEVFAIATNQALFHIWQATPTVQITNLSHPAISPNFQVGDTFQIRVWGPPYQPVYRSEAWNGNSTTIQIGATDPTGHFQIIGTETASQTGTYTDVYSVGNAQASPTISYVVAQSSGISWVATGERGSTPDGHVSGFTYLSISNGSSIWTSSTTYLDYAASAYYDTQTVATLYQNGQAIQQGVANGSSSASGSLSATAVPWNDYTLQTDHYVVAFFPIGFDFYNPFYLGDGSCVYASSDCSIGIGSGPILVIAASIYLGSTLGDLMAMPGFGNFVAPRWPQQGVDYGPQMSIALGAVTAATFYTLNREATNGSRSDPPIPMSVQLLDPSRWPYGDLYETDPVTFFDVYHSRPRIRTYVIRDALGQVWDTAYPIVVRERFTKVSGSGDLPDASKNVWANRVSVPGAQLINPSLSSMIDTYGLGISQSPIKYNQYYYATDFTKPWWWNPPNVYFDGVTQPLWIIDAFNTCGHGSGPAQTPVGSDMQIPGQTIYLTPAGVGFDGDPGPPPQHTDCADPTYP